MNCMAKEIQTKIFYSPARMGAVVETPSIYLDMTARDNLKTQYRVLGLPSFDGLEELLKLVGLEDTQKRKRKISPLVCDSV